MHIVNRSGRSQRRLALALAIIISGCSQIVFLIDSNTFAAERPGQKTSPNPNDPASQKTRESDKTIFARPRRVEQPLDAIQYASDGEPVIKVALMTDVSSITLTSPAGLNVRRGTTTLDEGRSILNGSLTVELRQQPEQVAPLRPAVAEYRISVGSATESRDARKLQDQLKKHFFEPVMMTFDEKQMQYAVLIGQFGSRAEAAQLLERLRKSGYENLRIISAQTSMNTLGAESTTDTNSRAAKYNARPGDNSTARSSVKSERRPIQLIALAADIIAASSEDELVISPALNRPRLDRSSQIGVVTKHERGGKHVTTPDQGGDFNDSESGMAVAPAAVRIGKNDYRGEIHLVLNPRGRINVVNALPLEDYLRGVVPMELSPGVYPEIEALKAQAVAARSYALAHLGQHRDEGFDLVDDTRAQVYGGLSSERELTNRAIDMTRGMAVVFPNEDGKLVPIEAVYTANCGGRTENNDEVFGGKPLPYLRAVACSPDREGFADRDIVSDRTPESLIGVDGRSIAREVALLSVLGFSMPHKITGGYLSHSADADDVRSWIEQTARLAQNAHPRFTRGDGTRLAEFACLVTASIYGERRASTLLAPADVDYLLGGLRVQQVPREARADVAMLLRNGILRVPASVDLDGRAPITRGQAIETLARAISGIPPPAIPKSQTSDSGSQPSNLRFQIPNFTYEVASPSEDGRLMIAVQGSPRESTPREKGSRFTSVNASGTGRLASSRQDDSVKNKPGNIAGKETANAVSVPREVSPQDLRRAGVEIADGAWLFRNIGGESHQVDRLRLIGGERVTYHLDSKGRVDFLEASISDRTASSDRDSSVAQWQERIPIEELQRRFTRARINVGRIEKIEPVAFSSSGRVTEVELSGDESRTRLRRTQIRAALGLKEYLFVVDRETDTRGQVVAFVFTGRGWGHGVGMCQTGAYGLAKAGYSYTAILRKYYTGVTLHKIY
jgi:SpoIID/LytB domain protein